MKKIDIKKNEIIKVAVFVVLAATLLWYTSLVLGYRDGGYYREKANEYKALDKDTIDVLFVGSSATDRFWIPAIAWEEEGITSFDLAMDAAPINLFPEMIEEARRTQDPDVIVVELRRAIRGADFFSNLRVRRVTENLLTGKRFRDAVDETYRTAEKYEDSPIDYTDKSYRYPFMRNHNGWRNIQWSYFTDLFPKSSQMGYVTRPLSYIEREQSYPELTDKRVELCEYSRESVETILDYCDTLDCEVVFAITPISEDEDSFGILNSAKDIVKARGYEVFDMNTEEFYESVGLDYSKDFYNEEHTNVNGATKVTRGIMKYLKENYDLEDHRGDAEYEEVWCNIFEELKAEVATYREDWAEKL